MLYFFTQFYEIVVNCDVLKYNNNKVGLKKVTQQSHNRQGDSRDRQIWQTCLHPCSQPFVKFATLRTKWIIRWWDICSNKNESSFCFLSLTVSSISISVDSGLFLMAFTMAYAPGLCIGFFPIWNIDWENKYLNILTDEFINAWKMRNANTLKAKLTTTS